MWPPDRTDSLITGWDKASIVIDFDNLEYYCSYLDKTIEREQASFKEKALKEAENMDDETQSHYFDYLSDEHRRLHDVFPSLHWNSTFITAYSLFEAHLNEICMILQRESKCQVKVRNIRGKGIERSKIYLSSVWKLQEPFRGKDWSKIKEYASIRNILAHNSGNLNLDKDGPEAHKKICEILKKDEAVEADIDGEYGIGRIILTPKITINSIKLYKKFLIYICNTEKPK